jgi:RNA polymerase sigma-70 factor (ECF subfamily)
MVDSVGSLLVGDAEMEREGALGLAASQAHVDRPHESPARLTALVRMHYEFLWRILRRMGVRESEVDDAAQRVLSVIARKISDIEDGREKSFIFQTALRVASEMRRSNMRSRTSPDEEAVARAHDSGPTPEEALRRKEARQKLDELLDQMPFDSRAVFILFELEEMNTSEIAAMLGIPAGTVSSRLHRAREQWTSLCTRARLERKRT